MNSYALLKKEAWPVAVAPSHSDINLIRRIASGDETALRELYLVYGQRLYAYALRLVCDPAMAEDVVQETLVAVWNSAGSFRGEGRLQAWLLGIVHNLALKSIRRQPLPISPDLEAILPDPAGSPEEIVQAAERSRWLRRGLDSLSTDHRSALELVFYQGLSLAEAAEVCGCPTGTIKSRLSYARQYLRAVLTRKQEDW